MSYRKNHTFKHNVVYTPILPEPRHSVQLVKAGFEMQLKLRKAFLSQAALTICQQHSQQKSAAQKEVFGTSKCTVVNDQQCISASVCTHCFKWLHCFLKEIFSRGKFSCQMHFSFIDNFCFCGLHVNYCKDSHQKCEKPCRTIKSFQKHLQYIVIFHRTSLSFHQMCLFPIQFANSQTKGEKQASTLRTSRFGSSLLKHLKVSIDETSQEAEKGMQASQEVNVNAQFL